MADSTAQSPCGPPSSGGSPLLASFQRPTASRQLPAAKRFLPSASGPPLPAICQRPTASYHLRAAHRFIPTASGSPLPTICQRLTASYTLLAAHRFAPSPSGPPLTAIVQRPPVVKQAFMQRANQPQECQTAGTRSNGEIEDRAARRFFEATQARRFFETEKTRTVGTQTCQSASKRSPDNEKELKTTERAVQDFISCTGLYLNQQLYILLIQAQASA